MASIDGENMKRYKWLLIDLDNTLFDFDAGKTVALNQLLKELFGAVEPRALDVYRAENKKCWQAVEAGQLSVDDVNFRRISKTLEALDYRGDHAAIAERYIVLLGENPILFDGVHQLLRQLKAHYRLAAITNGFASVKRPHLAKTGTGQFFEQLFISSELGVSKPHPLFFEKTLAVLDATAQDCLIIGDSLSSDILGGINSGIDSCWYKRRPSNKTDIKPTYCVTSYAELLALLMEH